MQNENHNFKTRPIVADPYRVKNLGKIKIGNSKYGVSTKKKRKRRLSKRQKRKLFFRYLTALIFLCGILTIGLGLYQVGKKTYNYLFVWSELDYIANAQLKGLNTTGDLKIYKILDESVRVITAYNAGDPAQTDASPCISASGDNICELIAQGHNVCASNWVPLHTMLRIEGVGECEVLDRMASRYSDRVDWAMPAHKKAEAIKFGGHRRNVQVIEEQK